MNVRIAMSPVETVKQYAIWRDDILSAVLDNGDGRVTEETVIDALLRREWHLLYTDKSVALAHVCVTPLSDVKVFYLHTAAGEIDDCLDAMDEIKVIAAHAGCQKIEVSGRKGWERALANRGFKFASLNLVADVPPLDKEGNE